MKYMVITGLFIASLTCHTNTSVTPALPADSNPTLAGHWQLQPMLASDTASGKVPVLDFDLNHSTFAGNSGCNTMSGSFRVKDDSLRFDEQIISTKIACPGYNEKAFLDNFMKTNRYKIDQGVLYLMFNATTLSSWVRHADTSTTREL
jgi:heat shock protein HslJ